MNIEELRSAILELEISQTDLTKLLDVTPRAVNTWLSGSRGIPGPVTAYLRLLRRLPANYQQFEKARLTKEIRTMKDGMYSVQFTGPVGDGGGILVFDSGSIYGADSGGGKYDGAYQFNIATGRVDLKIKVTMPPNSQSVLGPSNPYEWSLNVEASVDSKLSSETLEVKTDLGPTIPARLEFIRKLPMAA